MMNNPLVRRISATAVAILLLIYVGYQVYRSQYTGLKTEPAIYSTMSDSLTTTGYVLRNEQIIESSYSGVLNYTVDDGQKVSKDGVIAEVFPSEEGAAAQNRIARIEDELSQLEVLTSPGDFSASNPQLLGTQISEGVIRLLGDLRKGNFSALSDDKTDLQLLLSQKQIIVGAESGGDYAAYVSSLEAERDALRATASARSGMIRSSTGGYFIHSVDGYESAMPTEEILELSVSDVESLLESDPAPVSDTAIGKVARDFAWYIACVLTEDDLVRLGQIRSVSVEMPFASAERIPAEIVRINEDPATGNASAILRCTYMNSELAATRMEPLQIDLSDHSGVLVNEKAIHFVDYTAHETDRDGQEIDRVYENVQGVFIKSGSRIRFVQIFTDATINGYAVCKTTLSDAERNALVTGRTIQLYDEVVVEGTDLHDGKML